MKNSDEKLLEILLDLKNNHNVISVKTEFETEGTSFDEAKELQKLVEIANLPFTTKIGGCGALNDIYQAKKLNSKSIIAPMIETEYALKKFVQTIKKIYSTEELNNIKLFINIETITGYKNLKEIINSNDFTIIDGIVLGRNDLISSMNLNKKDVNSEKILEIASTIAIEMEKQNKTLIIGGCVDENSIDFFNKISSKSFKAFETRKIVFKKEREISKKSIQKAIEFELVWLENKKNKTSFDLERIKHLETLFIK